MGDPGVRGNCCVGALAGAPGLGPAGTVLPKILRFVDDGDVSQFRKGHMTRVTVAGTEGWREGGAASPQFS